MNKIDPLYILGFFVLMTLMMAYQGSSMERKAATQASINAKTEQMAKRFTALKERWKDRKKSQERIERVLGLRALSKHIIKKEKKQGKYRIEMAPLNASQINMLVSKIFNSEVRIKSVDLMRNGDKSVSAVMEFSL